MDNTKYEIPDDLKAAWDVLPQNCWERQLIERIARLGAPVSDEELALVAGGHTSNTARACRGVADRILAARQSAKEPPTPPSTKERQE